MKSLFDYIGNFWRWAAGDSAQCLEKCSNKARIRSAACGMLLPAAAIIAGAGMAYTAYLLTFSYIWAAVLGASWATVIAIIDRAIITTVTPGRGNFFRLIPRVLLTVVGSLIFAHALLFWFFGPALDRHMAADERAEAEVAAAKIAPQLEAARQRYQADIEKWEKRVAALAQSAAINAEEQRQKRQELVKWRVLLDDEKEGKRASGQPKAGAEYDRTIKDFITPAHSELDRLVRESDAMAAQQTKAQEALSKAMDALHNGAEVATLQERLSGEHAEIVGQNLRDFFSRMKALHALIASDALGLAGYIACCLFLLLAELSAVIVKLSAGKDDYTVYLKKEQFRAEEDFDNFQQIYPAISAERIEADLELEAEKHHLQSHLELALDKVRMVRVLGQGIYSEKELFFQLVDKIAGSSRKGASKEETDLVHNLAAKMLESFMVSAEHALRIFTRMTVPKTTPEKREAKVNTD